MDATADALARSQQRLVAVELAQVELVAHWADLHAGESLRAGRAAGRAGSRLLPGTEQEVTLGGDGTPRVSEFAATELGVLLGQTTHAARGLMRDVLDLRHRHPRLWDAVGTGRARFWQARQVARRAHDAGLDRDQTRMVDARTAPHLGLVPWGRMLTLVEAAVLEADPETAEQHRLASAMERFVRTGQCDDYGFTTIYARAEAGDAIFFLAMCDRIATILAANGDQDPVDVRRSKAIGILATPARALTLLQHATQPDSHDQPEPSPEPEPEPDEPEAGIGAGIGAGRAPVVVIDASIPADRFAPPATLYVHLSRDQFHGTGDHAGGAARVEDVGPVTVGQAVELLRHCRVTVKPVIDLHQSWAVDQYEIPARMAEQITLAAPVEVFPHGTHPSRRADKDHVIPYDPGGPPGQTSTENLAPLGRHHHRVKTHGHGWIHRQPIPGIHYWRTPQGTGHAWTTPATTSSAAPSTPPTRHSSTTPPPRWNAPSPAPSSRPETAGGGRTHPAAPRRAAPQASWLS